MTVVVTFPTTGGFIKYERMSRAQVNEYLTYISTRRDEDVAIKVRVSD